MLFEKYISSKYKFARQNDICLNRWKLNYEKHIQSLDKMDEPNTNKIQAHLSQFILIITKKTKILSVK